LKCVLKWASKLEPIIQQNEEVGEIAVIDESGKVIQRTPLLALEKVEPKPRFWLESKIKQSVSNPKKLAFVAVFALLLIGLLVFLKRRR